jgi:hypothetical protein
MELDKVNQTKFAAEFIGGDLDGTTLEIPNSDREISIVQEWKLSSGNLGRMETFRYKLVSEGPPLRYEAV